MPRRGGWRRLGRKRFRYVDSRGRAVQDEAALERIADLTIPPAWEDVWISPNAGAKLQATGVDAAGRRQYLYHPDFRAAQEAAKFDRLLHFGKSLPSLRAATRRHLQLGAYERDWACALAVTLVNHAWFRVGSDRHARTSRTYGITTLTKRHVTIAGDRIEFRFRGKNSTLIKRTVANRRIARELARLAELENGSRLFRYERDGETFNLTSDLLNDYLGENMGNGFTAKDFRTWGGTLLAATKLATHGPSESDGRSQARARVRDAKGGRRAREHTCRGPRLVRLPDGRRALPRRPHDRRFPTEERFPPGQPPIGRGRAHADASGENLRVSRSRHCG